jgi:pimeloyl-ACP methyl ester carboxylesterase
MEISPYHPFRSAQAKEEYLTYYDERAKGWPIASETRMVNTSFGQTFVRIGGPSDSPPLVLLPGSVFNSLMWIPNIEALSNEYRTYAIDNIYDCGRSIYTQEIKTPIDFVQWLDELFTALDLGNEIRLMGLSYGSWLTHQYALQHPQRVKKIVLLAHPAIVRANIEFVFRFMLGFLSPNFLTSFFHWILRDTAQKDERSRALLEGIIGDVKLVAKCFKPKATVVPKLMTDDELRNIKVPALFLMGENEKTFSHQKAVERIMKVAPQLQTETIPHAGHDLNLAQADLVNKKVLAFLK